MEPTEELVINHNKGQEKPINAQFPNSVGLQNNFNKGPLGANINTGQNNHLSGGQSFAPGFNRGPLYQVEVKNHQDGPAPFNSNTANLNKGFLKEHDGNPARSDDIPNGVRGSGVKKLENEPNKNSIPVSNQYNPAGAKLEPGSYGNQVQSKDPYKNNIKPGGGGNPIGFPNNPQGSLNKMVGTPPPISELNKDHGAMNQGFNNNPALLKGQSMNEVNADSFGFQPNHSNFRVGPNAPLNFQPNPGTTVYGQGQVNKPVNNPDIVVLGPGQVYKPVDNQVKPDSGFLGQSSVYGQLNPHLKEVSNFAPSPAPVSNQSKPPSEYPPQNKFSPPNQPQVTDQHLDRSKVENQPMPKNPDQNFSYKEGPVMIKPSSNENFPQFNKNPPKLVQNRLESPSKQLHPGQGNIKKLGTNQKQIPIPLNHEIPKNDVQFNPKKYLPEEILGILYSISTGLVEVLDLNMIIRSYQEFQLKLNQLSQRGINDSKKILELIESRLYCKSCESRSYRMLELKCSHVICEQCISNKGFNSLKSSLDCPCCGKPVDLIEENLIFSTFEIDRDRHEKERLKRKLYENNGLKCEKCNKLKKIYYEYCPHVCKECSAENVRDGIYPCVYCIESTDFKAVYNEVFECNDCGVSNYFVGSYGKFVNDEKNILCITCSYAYYNSGLNETLGLRLRKIEKIELSEHIFRNCNLCKQDKYKGNFKRRSDCQHYICIDCEGGSICKECA